MLETLISSKTRIKLLLKFFLNSKTKSYLRNLESEFGESTNAIRVELNRLENEEKDSALNSHEILKELTEKVKLYQGMTLNEKEQEAD